MVTPCFKVNSESAVVRASIKVWSRMFLAELENAAKGAIGDTNRARGNDESFSSSGFVLKGIKSQPALNGTAVNVVLGTGSTSIVQESRVTVELKTASGATKSFKVKWANIGLLERGECPQSGEVSHLAGMNALNKITLASAAAVLAHKRAHEATEAEAEGAAVVA